MPHPTPHRFGSFRGIGEAGRIATCRNASPPQQPTLPYLRCSWTLWISSIPFILSPAIGRLPHVAAHLPHLGQQPLPAYLPLPTLLPTYPFPYPTPYQFPADIIVALRCGT